MTVRRTHIARVLGRSEADAGQFLADLGYVQIFSADPVQGTAAGIVRDEGGRSHRIVARIRHGEGARPELVATCSCGRQGCMHAAALLWKAFDPVGDAGPHVTPLTWNEPPPSAWEETEPPADDDARRPQSVAGRRIEQLGRMRAEARAAAREPEGAPSKDATRTPALDRATSTWLDRLSKALARTGEEEHNEPTRSRLVYRLEVSPDPTPRNPRGTQLLVHPLIRQRLKRGGWNDGKDLRWDPYYSSSAPDCLTPLDETILGLVALAGVRTGGTSIRGAVPIRPSRGAGILAALLPTGRAHWLDVDGPALRPGPARTAQLGWRVAADGSQSPMVETKEAGLVLLPLEPPWYVDPGTAECGPLETGVSARALQEFQRGPALAPEAAARVREVLERQDCSLPVPQSIRVEDAKGPTRPVPCLRLRGLEPRGRLAAMFPPGIHLPLATLSFAYGAHRVAAKADAEEDAAFAEGVLHRFRRDPRAELRALDKLEDLGWWEMDDMPPLTGVEFGSGDLAPIEMDDVTGVLEFVRKEVPRLRKQGWVVEVDDSFPYRLVEGTHDWYADLESGGSGEDWFGFELGVEIAGRRENLLPVLIEVLQRKRRDGRPYAELTAAPQLRPELAGPDDGEALVRLEDGRLLPIPVARLRAILDTLEQLHRGDQLPSSGRLRVSPLQAGALPQLDQDLGDGTLRWSGDPRLRELGRSLREAKGLPEVEAPGALRATLRPYQQDGLAWLQFLRQHGLGGILADDMGLGKTVQALAHLLVEAAAGRADRPSLVVAPTSVVVNWARECERFAPTLRVHLHHGPARKDRTEIAGGAELILTTYPLLWRDREEILAREYHLLLLDEAQFLKNPRSQAAQVAAGIRARQRLCLTGTPLENRLLELWSLFNVVLPGALGDERHFKKLFATPIEKHGDVHRRTQLAARVRPFLLRRTKEKVASELPPRSEMTRAVELEGAQRDLYETIRLAMHQRVADEVQRKGFDRSRIVILDALLKLRQVCCDPRLVKLPQAAKVRESAKLQALLEMLDEMMAEGRRVLLYSQFTSMLGLIEHEVGERKLRFVKLTGETRDRKTPVDSFQAGKADLFLISLKAGGTGLNLTAADTVILYDPWWNPAVEDQAAGRAHRIGQDKPVFVYRLIAAGSVEERILALQERKRTLARGVLGGAEDGGAALTADDLEALFEPLG